jgi:hypothetical protein
MSLPFTGVAAPAAAGSAAIPAAAITTMAAANCGLLMEPPLEMWRTALP